MGKRLGVMVLVCFAAIGCSAFAQEPIVEFEGRYWVTDLDAKVKVVRSSIGTEFDLRSDLGVEDEDFPEGRIILHTGPNSKLRASFTQVSYSGEKDIISTVQFKGQSYTAGTRVKSDFDLQYFGLDWIWQFVNLFDKIKAGPIIGVKAVSSDVSLNAASLGINESDTFIAGLPVVGMAVDIKPIEQFAIFGEISGISAGDYGYFFDVEAGVKIIPIKNFCLTGGYRVLSLKAEDDPDYAEVEIKGPFASATIRF